MPEDQAWSCQFLDGEEIELLSQHAMIAFLRLLDRLEILLEVLLRVKRSPINPLELRVLLVIQPVGAGEVQEFEGLDSSRTRNVRSPAEVDELAVAIERNLVFTFSVLLNEVHLHPIVFRLVLTDRLVSRHVFTDKLLVPINNLLHALLNALQVLGSELRSTIEVVEEAGFSRWTMPKLRLGEQLGDGGCQYVSRGMPEHLKRLGILLRENPHFGVFFDRPIQIDDFAVHLGGKSGIGEARRDRLGYIVWRRPTGQFTRGSIGQSDL